MDHTSTLTGLQRTLKGSRAIGSIDVIYTKLAVDLQNLEESSADVVVEACLDVIRDSAGCDVVCLALFDRDCKKIDRVQFAQADFTSINAEQLQGTALTDFPWIAKSIEHLRLLEVRDTGKPLVREKCDDKI